MPQEKSRPAANEAAPKTLQGDPSADQLQLAFADRHAGQEANLAAGQTVHRDDRGRVETAVADLARSGLPFTADTVHNVLGDGEPYDRNLVSSVIGIWARHGRIVEDASIRPVASVQRSRRASRNRWWCGTSVRPDSDRNPTGIRPDQRASS